MNTIKGLIAGAIAALGVATLTQADELRISTPTPPPHIFTKTANHMAEALASSSQDDTLAVFPVNKLGNVPTVLSLLQSGALEMAVVPVGDLANRDPAFLAWFLPYQFENLAEAGAAAQSAPAREMLDRLERQGLVGLGYVFPGQRHVLSKSEITDASDLSGLKIRAFPNDIFSAWWREVDAAPTALPLPEIMPSLVTGVIDAVDVDLDIVMGLKMFEQAPNLIMTNHMSFPGAILASKQWWDGLSAEDQANIESIVSDSTAWALEAQIKTEAALPGVLADNGANVTTIDDAALRTAGAAVTEAFLERDPMIKTFYDANR
ncbi:MAG: TRAP transporter substrate-binding protein [Pseudomonadota bacterium]